MARGRKPKQTDIEDAPKPGHNGFDPKAVSSFVARIEGLHGDLLHERSQYMLRCKGVREDISLVYDDAKDAGVPKRALKSVVKARELEAKAAKVRDELEAEDMESHDLIRQALGDLAELPLGQAVLAQHPDTSDRPFGAPPQ